MKFTRLAAAPLLAAALLAPTAAPANAAVLGNTVAYRFAAGGDGYPSLEVTLVAQTLAAQFNCKAVSDGSGDTTLQTRAICRLYQAGTLVASADSGWVPGAVATANGFRLGASVFLEACVEGFSRRGQSGTRSHSTCADVLVS